MDRKYLVYKITNRFDGKIYIGVHSTLNKNDRYMGSGTEIKEALKKFGRKFFIKETLATFDTKEEMLAKEKELVTKEFCMRSDTYNRIEGGGTYLSLNMISVKDKNGNTSKVYNDDSRYLSGELVGVTKGLSFVKQSVLNKGKVPVKDKFGDTFRIDKNDPRYLSGELVHVAKGNPATKGTTGMNHSDETKLVMSGKAGLRVKEKNSMFGKTRSEEFKSALRDKFGIEFYIYDKEGNFVSKEKSVNEYAEKIGMNPSSIIKVLKGKYEVF